MSAYFGKICSKHPDLLGERYASCKGCKGCARESVVRREKARFAVDPEYKAQRYAAANKRIAKKRKELYGVDPEFTAKRVAQVIARNAAKIQRTPAWADKEKIAAIYVEAQKQGLTVDHIYPLRGKYVSGLHVPENLQLLSMVENARKNNAYSPS